MKIGELCRYLGCGCSFLKETRLDVKHNTKNEAAYFFINLDSKNAYPTCLECKQTRYAPAIAENKAPQRVWISISEDLLLPVLLAVGPTSRIITKDFDSIGNHMNHSDKLAKFLKQRKLW